MWRAHTVQIISDGGQAYSVVQFHTLGVIIATILILKGVISYLTLLINKGESFV